MNMMNIVNQLQGMGVSPGIAIGRACVIRQQEAGMTGVALTDDDAVGREIARFHDSVRRSIRELRALMAGTEATVAEILEVQVELLQDPMWEGEVLSKIGADRKNAGDAVLEVTQALIETFGSMEDEYLRARAADIEDIGKRVMRHLRGEDAGASDTRSGSAVRGHDRDGAMQAGALRAGVFGECRILLPMIGNVQELRQAKALITEAKEELTRQQLPYDADIRTGIMIEVPSAAIMADQLAKETDFFSIGTNDLCQYTLAVDRMNEKINALYDPFHPAVLRLIRNVIEQGYLHQLPVEMCGELAGDPQATLLLLGMGLRDFSMNAPSIPVVKNIILQASMAVARAVYAKEMSNIV
jgi:phosphoenolpyruvate-protein kinase (PTS system EI component)